MLKNERLILEKVLEKISSCQWSGWERRVWSYRSQYFKYKTEKYVHVVGLRTILPDALLKLEIRFYFTGPRQIIKFDPEKHKEYMYELKLIDDLARFDERIAFEIYCYYNEKDVELLAEIFEKARQKTVFIDKSKIRRCSIKKLLQIM